MAKSRFTASIASAKRLLKPIAAGILLSVPFWQVNYGWLLIPCVIGYLLWLDQKPSTKQIWLSGAVFFSIIANWMYHIKATELIPDNVLAIAFLVLTFSIVVGTLSLGFLLFGYLYNKFKVELSQPRALILVPALWAVGEWFRSSLFSIVGMGPGGILGAHWNFGSLAFPASITPFGYGARVVGQFGLSALIIALSIGIIQLVKKQKFGIMAVGAVVAICLAGRVFYIYPEGSQLSVGALQLDDSSYSDYGYQRDLGPVMSSHDPSSPIDILVMPEYSYIFTQKEYKNAETIALKKVTTSQSLIITSKSGEARQGHKNLVTFYKPDGQIVTQQQKQFLIPAGEYIPYFYEWILVLSGNTSVIGNHQVKNTVSPSDQAAKPVAYKDENVGSLACSGAIAPEFYRKLVSSGATVLTNSAALSTMGLSSSYYAQARQMAAFLAVANARPFVQSARGAQVFMLDQNGQTVAKSDKPGVHYIEGNIKANNKRTPYSYVGELGALILSMGAILYLGVYRKYF